MKFFDQGLPVLTDGLVLIGELTTEKLWKERSEPRSVGHAASSLE